MQIAPLIEMFSLTLLFGGSCALLAKKCSLPITLGYMVGGILIGPFGPLASHLHSTGTAPVKTLAEIGILLLMFSLGLEFGFRKLRSLGLTPVATGLTEGLGMWALGTLVSQFMGLNGTDSLFIGASLAVSSTTIIVKSLAELNLKTARFSETLYGILLVEDLVAILIIVTLSSFVGGSTALHPALLIVTLVGSVFVWWFLGSIFAPRVVDAAHKNGGDELLVILSVALCMSLAVLSAKWQLSAALGAFVMGSILADTRQLRKIETLVTPLRDVFAALFFVSFGMLVDFQKIIENWKLIGILIFVLVFGKFIINFSVNLILGKDLKDCVRIAASLVQIGEFSFVIMEIGSSSGVISEKLFPIIVGVATVTIVITPYSIKASEVLARKIENILPRKSERFLASYADTLQSWNFNQWAMQSKLSSSTESLKFKFLKKFQNRLRENYLRVTKLSKASTLDRLAPWDEYLVEISVDAYSVVAGHSLMELNLREDYGINVVAVERESGSYISPDPKLRLYPEDQVLVYGLEVDIAKFALACQARDSILESSHSSEALQDCELTSFVTSAAHPFCGKTLMELRIREKFHCTILGVGRGEERIKNPPSDFLLQNEDIIYAVGSRIQIEKMKRGEI
jgi:CPA2 family monovalent cation:H+ antiporter-2